MAAQKTNWKKAQKAYITSSKSAREIAAEFGVSEHMVSEHCRKEHWRAQRKEYRQKCYDKAMEKSINAEAERLGKLIDAVDIAGDVAEMGLLGAKRAFEQLPMATPEERERLLTLADSKAARDYTLILKEAIGMMRAYYDLPTAAEKEAREIAKERMELEKKRLEHGINAVDGLSEHGVCLLPAVMAPQQPPEAEEEHE